MKQIKGDKASLKVEFGCCDNYWNIRLEQYNKDLYMITLEQYEAPEGITICTEQLMDDEDLDELVEIINQVRK